jgi:endonuclease III
LPPPVPSAEQVAKAARIRSILSQLYPPEKLVPPLTWKNHFELLCCVVLSAQTTDKKVNEVTPALFAAAAGPGGAATPSGMAALPVDVITSHIKQLGLAPSKAVYLSTLSKQLLERHAGEVPRTFAELEALSGVGHKTAGVVLSHAFGMPAFPVDTHIHRLAVRWGLCMEPKATVVHVERDLKSVFPEDSWNAVHLQLIFFGREHCPAQRHDASKCPICSWGAVPVVEDVSPASPGPASPDGGGGEAKKPAKKKATGKRARPQDSEREIEL